MRLFARLLAILLLAWGATASAQKYPSKVVTIVAPYPAGGSIDLVARLVGGRLATRLGQPVIVKNIAGGSGMQGTRAVAKAEPDGYTLLLANPGPNAIAPSLYANLDYDIEKDFAPISLVSTQPAVIAVSAASPVRSIQELVALGRSSDKGTLGSAGQGVASHLIGELFQMQTGARFTHVPYKGTAPLALALLRNEISVGVLTAIDALPHIRSGKLRGLAVASSRRSPQLPEVPTVAETVAPGFGLEAWYGLMAPGLTPRPIVARLHREIIAVLGEAAVAERMNLMASVVTPSTPEEFAERIRTDAAKYAGIIRAVGVKGN